jgi:predicted protein tyrosine phosphatase
MEEIREGFYIGDISDAKHKGKLNQKNITLILNLSFDTISHDLLKGVEVEKERLKDGSNDKIELQRALDRAVDYYEYDQNTLIVCKVGQSRSVSIASGAIAITENMSLREAVNEVRKESGRQLHPNPELLKGIKGYIKDRV